MEWLRSCYSSQWQLLAGGPPTRGYYYKSPPGTPHYPGVHWLGSRNWLRGGDNPVAPMGELLGVKQLYRKGNLVPPPPPAVLVGSSDCIANGDAYPLPAVSRTLPYGIDSRCYPGAPPADVVPPQDMTVWLDAATLPATPSSAPVAIWPDLSQLANPAVQTDPNAQPNVVTGGNPPVLVLAPVQSLTWPTPVPLGGSFTVFMVGLLLGDVFHPFTNGTALSSGSPGAILMFSGRNSTDVLFPGFHGSLPQASGPGQTYLVWAVVGPGAVTISQWNGQSLTFPVLGPVPPQSLAGLSWHRDLPIGPNNAGLFDVLAYDRALSAAELSAVSGYLAQLHGL